MRYHLPPLNALRAFEAAARLQSFSLAAAELRVTQGAISRHIKILEETLDTKLFRRSHRQVTLTEDGRALRKTVREAFELIEEQTNLINPHYADQILRVKSLPTFALRWLIPRLSRFSEKHSEVKVSIHTSHRFADFDSGDVDVSIEWGRGGWKGSQAELLFPTMLVPVCSPKLANGAGPPRSIADLAKYVLLHSEQRPNLWNQWLSAAGAPSIITHDVARFEDSGLVYQAALDGLGVAIAEAAYVRNDFTNGRLVQPFPHVEVCEEGYYFVYPANKLRLRKVSTFRNWITGQAKSVIISEMVRPHPAPVV
jgi:LysR family glycine cleavage system transcriptional activator